MAPRFFIGPARWLAEDSPLSANERLVLAVLCRWTNRTTGECFPALPTIAQCAGLSVRTVQRAILGLVKHKAVALRQRKGPNGAPMSSVYFVLGFDSTPAEMQGGGDRQTGGVVTNRHHRGVRRAGGVVSISPPNVNVNGNTEGEPSTALSTRVDQDGTIWLGNTPYRSRL